MISVSIDRSGLSLAPLVVATNPFAASLYLPEEGAVWPVFDTRYDWAPDSAWARGRQLLAAVKGAAELPLSIYAKGTSGADLAAQKAVLEQALAQFAYDLTLTVDSVAYTYPAWCVLSIPWGPIDSGMVTAHLARTSFTIPLNPGA